MTGRLNVSGLEPASEVVVRDHALRVVSAAPGALDATVQPGIYRVDVWVPGMTDISLVAVRDNERVEHDPSGLAADSVVPVAGIRTASNHHARFAAQVAAELQHTAAGAGDDAGWLFLFTRSRGAPRFAMPLVSVLDLTGTELFRLDQHGQVDAVHGCAGLSVGLHPGYYVLRHTVPGRGARGQVVRVAAGYQTQVFAPWAEDHVDLAAAVICMPPLGTGFDPADRDRYLLAEQAVRALTTGRAGPEPDHQDPLMTMMDDAVRILAGRPSALVDTTALNWTDPVLLQSGLMSLPGPLVAGPPVLDAVVALVSEQADRYQSSAATWPDGLRTASTSGSVWARWDLDAAPLAPAAASAARLHVVPDTWTRPRLRIKLAADAAGLALAAADTLIVSFGRGQHINVLIWGDDDPADAPPRAEVGVRIGARALIYQRSGEPMRYGGEPLPARATAAVPMTVSQGENLLAHLAQQLRFGQED